MPEYPVPNPTAVERALFAALIPREKPSYEVFYTTGLITRPPYEPELPRPSNIHNPDDWDNWLVSSVRGEWYAYVLRNCQKVLDIGSGGGYPSLYIARTIPEVVGVEPGICEIEYARELQRSIGLNNVTFLQESALALPFPDNSFDGACFCTSLESTGDARRALLEARRVVERGGVIAIQLAPLFPGEKVQLYVTDDGQGNPVVGYIVVTTNPMTGRRYQMYLKPESRIGQQVRSSILNQEGDPKIIASEILEELKHSQFDMIQHVEYYCVRRFSPQQLRVLLLDLGLKDIIFWAPPSGSEFAKTLREEGLLQRMTNDQLFPYLRALVRSSKTFMVESDFVTVVNEE